MIKIFIFACCICFMSCGASKNTSKISIPEKYLGHFADDYGITYTVTDSLFLQEPGIKYKILKWDTKSKYIIAKNGSENPSEKNLYTRIDYMEFENMAPFLWGFCFTVYKAHSDKEAENATPADRNNPRKGCNGFPFSRMKRIP